MLQHQHQSVQSVSIAALLKAGKLGKRKVPEKPGLEYFDLQSIMWKDFTDVGKFIEKESFTVNSSNNFIRTLGS